MIWSNVISSLLGALAGGFITWFSTKKSIEKQFDFENKKKEINEKKSILKTLTSIKREVEHNVMQAKITIEKLEKRDKTRIKIEPPEKINIKNNQWERLNQNLYINISEKLMEKLELFYYNISHEITSQTFTKKRSKKILENGATCHEILEKNIKIIKNKIKKLENSHL